VEGASEAQRGGDAVGGREGGRQGGREAREGGSEVVCHGFRFGIVGLRGVGRREKEGGRKRRRGELRAAAPYQAKATDAERRGKRKRRKEGERKSTI